MTKGNKKQYIVNVKVINYLLQAIPIDIYNSVDACKNAKDMWERIKRLMFGSDVTSHVMVAMVTGMHGDKMGIKHLMQAMGMMKAIRLFSVFHEVNQFKQFTCLEKKPNKVYDPFLKDGLGYKYPERLKKAIATQPKMYHGEMLHSSNLKIDSPDYEETLEDVETSRLNMRNKMVPLNYGKLNALYETFVPQQEPYVEQTYFSFPSTSNDYSESKEVTSDLPILKMPKESKLLKKV
nr:hypothetical protein [Tanacetum cinerariifolium]